MVNYVVKIFRFDPTTDSRPTHDVYRFGSAHVPTILETLETIYQEHDGTLAFRGSCGLGRCGSCTVMLNGRPVLACQTKLPAGESVIEPLLASNCKIVKDLIVDRYPYNEFMVVKKD